ncbi:carboxylesterase family protein [Fulvivirga sediminis]|uniref:Carboxylesterase family protein n=1 Tax=Fulvivirga sediminis TaxID=2803949 RepID=A0A937FEB8_9BACT|nr:carboxylesterase family protein [Fulvivirga sediminis]MBL3658963.1 carboxylesterase family protein [Fulvivirga sediminis]
MRQVTYLRLDKENPKTTEADIALSEAMSSYWVNFTEYGNPNAEGLPNWPQFSKENQQLMCLKDEPHASAVPDEKAMRVFDSYYQWRLTEEVQNWAK